MRRRRKVAAWLLVVLRPLFRFSYSRSAYVLRIIGGHAGPVLQPRKGGKR